MAQKACDHKKCSKHKANVKTTFQVTPENDTKHLIPPYLDDETSTFRSIPSKKSDSRPECKTTNDYDKLTLTQATLAPNEVIYKRTRGN